MNMRIFIIEGKLPEGKGRVWKHDKMPQCLNSMSADPLPVQGLKAYCTNHAESHIKCYRSSMSTVLQTVSRGGGRVLE